MNSTSESQNKIIYSELTRNKRLKILLTVAIGTFMGPLDSSVVNIALPNISSSFNVSLAVVEWVVMSYLLIISSLLLTFGRLGDMYGHKKIYVTGFVIFTVGSVLCGSAWSITTLVMFRVVQAVGAGMLMAVGPAIVTDISPPGERGKSLGIIAVSVSVALTTGPVLGGILTTKFGWPSIFFINVPVGIIALILARRLIPDTKGVGRKPFDIRGAVTIFASLVLLLFSLSYSEKMGLQNPYIIGSFIFGLLLLVSFIIVEKRIPHPMVDLDLFHNRLFAMANLSALFNYIAMFSAVIIMPFYLQDIRNLSPAEAGILMIPMPLTTMVVAPISGAFSDRFDSRYISSIGMLITCIGMFLLSQLRVDSSITYLIVSLIIVGLGAELFQTPNNSAIMGSVPANRRGIASGLLASMRNIGMVMGVAISGAIFTWRLKLLTKALEKAGLTGSELQIRAFTGALELAFFVSAGIAAAAVITSLIRGKMN